MWSNPLTSVRTEVVVNKYQDRLLFIVNREGWLGKTMKEFSMVSEFRPVRERNFFLFFRFLFLFLMLVEKEKNFFSFYLFLMLVEKDPVLIY